MILNNPVGIVVTESLSYVGGPTVVLMLVVVGYGLKFSKNMMKEAALATFWRYIICGVLCVAMLGLFSLFMEIDNYMFWAIILEFTLPPAYCVTVFIKDERETGYIDSALSLCTVVSIIFFIVIAIFVK